MLSVSFNLAPVQEQAIISTIEDFMWLKLHMVQPTAHSSSSNPRLSPNSSSTLLTPAYSLSNLQDEVVRWGPDFFSQNGAQPLVYVVVLLLSQHFRRAAEWMHTRPELQQHAVHIAIALNHCQVRFDLFLPVAACTLPLPLLTARLIFALS